MSDEARKLIALIVAVAAVLALLVWLAPRMFGALAGPEIEVLTALKEAEAKGLTLEVGEGPPLISKRVNFQRISVSVEGEGAVVTATLDFDGTYQGIFVSSLGLERVPFALRDGAWVPTEGFAPRLSKVVKALEQRRAALERGEAKGRCDGLGDGGPSAPPGDEAALAELFAVQGRKLKATSWLIRSERDDVVVSEDYRVSGTLPDRPVDDSGTRRLKLQAAAGGQFCFPEGLM